MNPTHRIVPALAIIVVLGFLAVVGWLITSPAAISEAGMLALGALMSAFTGVIGFYFGSSIGSRDKDTIGGMK